MGFHSFTGSSRSSATHRNVKVTCTSKTSPPAHPEGQQIGSLWISSQVLGFGSVGTIVFRGQLGSRQVAVKRILKPFVQVAAQEVSSLISSDLHVNVVRYFTQESDENFIYLALELCECTLAEVLENKLHPLRQGAKFVSKVQIRDITKQVLAGLDYLHSQQMSTGI